MRLIGTLSNESYARRITSYLKQKGIDSNCEMSFDAHTGQMSYLLWILDEDKIAAASSDFERFQKEPSSAEFDASVMLRVEEEEESPNEEERDGFPPNSLLRGVADKKTPFTFVVLFLCAAIFFLNGIQEIPLRQEGLQNVFTVTPIQIALLYDVPPAFVALGESLRKEGAAPQTVDHLTPEVELQLEEIERIPFWRGVYDWAVLRAKGEDSSLAEGPLFSQIRQGEIWRLISPCFLHSQFLHILFNMIWLWVLGRPIEQRIGVAKTMTLTVLSGVGSNTVQYLMSGPFFIGYSGVVMALAGFIWMREKVAPWEGYPLNRTTILFLLIFIVSMLILSTVSFFLQLFTSVAFAPNIANTAHIVGALIGICLGKFSFFAQKVSAK